jgi:hypothetical protein
VLSHSQYIQARIVQGLVQPKSNLVTIKPTIRRYATHVTDERIRFVPVEGKYHTAGGYLLPSTVPQYEMYTSYSRALCRRVSALRACCACNITNTAHLNNTQNIILTHCTVHTAILVKPCTVRQPDNSRSPSVSAEISRRRRRYRGASNGCQAHQN